MASDTIVESEQTVTASLTKKSNLIPCKINPQRAKKLVDLRKLSRLCRERWGYEAIKTIVKMMRDVEVESAVRLRCAETILNRGFGMCKQEVDINGDGSNMPIINITLSQPVEHISASNGLVSQTIDLAQLVDEAKADK